MEINRAKERSVLGETRTRSQKTKKNQGTAVTSCLPLWSPALHFHSILLLSSCPEKWLSLFRSKVEDDHSKITNELSLRELSLMFQT